MAKEKEQKDTKVYNGSTVVRPCVCVSAYQDARYGYTRRVHNVGKVFGCTVCGNKVPRPSK